MIDPHSLSTSVVRTPNIAIRASAGSGKTYALTLRYLRLLAQGAHPEEILATTFTRKAAGEILARVLDRLAEAVLQPEKNAELIREIGAPNFSSSEIEKLFDRVADALPDVRVGTMDRYFAQRAREIGWELELPPGWTMIDEFDDAQLRDQAIEELLHTAGTKAMADISQLLSKGEVQRSIRRQINELVLQLQAIYRDAPASAWEALPRMAELTPAALEAALDHLEHTDAGTAKSILKARGDDLACARAQLWKEFIGKGIPAKLIAGERKYSRVEIPHDLARAYQAVIDHAAAVLRNRIVAQNQATYQLVSKYDVHYRLGQLRTASVRFVDVTRAVADAEEADTQEAESIRHLLIDEFQDTSPSQWKALARLARRCDSDPNGSFFCVGDPKQAIYGWRGGVAELFDVIDRDVLHLDRQSLQKSYRSSPVIIDVVNNLFGRLMENAVLADDPALAPVAERWSQRFELHETARVDRGGYARMVVAPVELDDVELSLARYAANEIADRHQQRPQATIGVLVRENRAVARLLFELRRLGIEASEEGGNPLSRSPAVGVILSFLTMINHPDDSVASFHVRHSPLGKGLGIFPETSALEIFQVADAWRRRFLHDGYARTVRGLVTILAPGLGAIDQDRLDQLVELAIRFEARPSLKLSDFVRYIETTKVDDPRSAQIRVMTVHQAKGLEFDIVFLPQLDKLLRGQPPTFIQGRPTPTDPVDVVLRYVNDDERSLLPERLQGLFEDHRLAVLIESLCVLYVAMTRAVHELHLIIAPSKSNERKIPVTFAGLLRAGLAGPKPIASGAILFEAGDWNWKEERFEEDVPTKREIVVVPPPDWGKAEPAEVILSPSALSRHAVSVHSLLHVGNEEAKQRGSILHSWLAQIGWSDDPIPTDEELFQDARLIDPNLVDGAALIAEFRSILSHPELQSLWKLPEDEGNEIELWRERSFALRHDRGITRGIFDRVVVWKQKGRPTQARIIDFKTDRIADVAAIPLRAEVHRPQLEAYRSALARMLELPEEK